MGFRKLRLFPITADVGADGYPTYGTTALKLQAGASGDEEVNAVEISLQKVTKEKTLNADDKERTYRVATRYTGTLQVYSVNADAAKDIFGYIEDTNKNLIQVENSTSKKKFGVFFEGKDAKGNIFQKYLYNVVFNTPDEVHTTDDGTTVPVLSLTLDGYYVDTTDGQVAGATVYAGNTGFVAAEPSSMYKKA